MKGQYGEFSKTGDAFIINRPDTPKPWVNMITNGNYCMHISQTAGGYSFVGDADYNRITREIPGDNVNEDRPGRYIYIRDNDTGEFWSLTWQPVMKTPDHFQARHNIGSTVIESSYAGIDGSVTFFVPLDDPCEIWQTKLTNFTEKKRRLSVFVFVEWDLGIHRQNTLEASFNDLFNNLLFKDNTIFATKRRWETPERKGLYWDKVAFLTMDHQVDSFDCVKEKFFGRYGDITKPQAVVDGKCSRSQGLGHRAVGVLQRNITLGPKAQTNFNVLLGVGYTNPEAKSFTQAQLSGIRHAKKIITKYNQPKEVEKAYEQVQEFWRTYNSQVMVNTPDEYFNYSVNYWNKYQAWITAKWSLMDTYYIGGGSTIGYRDMSQHIIGVMPNDIHLAKSRLKELLSFQFKEGRTVHNWNNLTKLGVVTNHSDDAQWLVTALVFYLKEVGSLAFLKEHSDYYDGGSGTVLEHLIRAMEYSLANLSTRHLPYRMAADWNDALNSEREAQGESQMVACQICYNLRELLPIFEAAGEHELATKYQRAYDRIKEAINKHLWDGGWYLRGTTKNHGPIGSKKSRYNQIDINAQSWAVMAGVADGARGVRAMDAVWRRLNTKYGPAMFLPAYQHPEEKYGVISQFTPGTKENGAIFNHPVAWAVIAETILGRGDKAFEFWKETNFAYRGENQELYRVEPYVYAEFVYGPEHPEFGRGSFTWATGSASWFWRGCLDYILGVQPVLGGLKIDPCIPRDWRQVEVTRKFRGAEYHIRIQNPFRINKGVDRILVDGNRLTGTVIPAHAGGTHFVEVVLG
jgi:cellobiose phosphorylase